MPRWKSCGIPVLAAAVLSVAVLPGCAGKGHVSNEYGEDLFRIERQLAEGTVKGPQKFIVYGDNQASWRLREAFSRDSWTDRKMFIFPFYQVYLIGSGAVGSVNWFRHVPDRGGEERRQVRDAIFERVIGDEISFVLNVGDVCAHDGRRPSHWGLFLEENRVEVPLVDSVPYVAMRGNHEVANDSVYGENNFQSVFGVPRFDTIEMDEALLILLDSNLIVDQKQFIDDDTQDELFARWFVSDGGGEPSWLERQLDSADKRFVMVAMHHPLVTFAGHERDWLNDKFGRDLHGKRLKLLRMMSAAGVDVVFSGHDHLYQHTRYTGPDGNSISFIIGGGGGAYLRKLLSDDDIERTRARFASTGDVAMLVSAGRFHHFETVDVREGRIVIEVNRTGGSWNGGSPHRIIEISADGSFSDTPVEEAQQ